jgi:hypothetical protein
MVAGAGNLAAQGLLGRAYQIILALNWPARPAREPHVGRGPYLTPAPGEERRDKITATS